MQSQYMHFLGIYLHRVIESYNKFLCKVEYSDIILAKSIALVIRKYELEITR